MWKILACVLHLGNVNFKENSNEKEGCIISTTGGVEFKWISETLGIDE